MEEETSTKQSVIHIMEEFKRSLANNVTYTLQEFSNERTADWQK